MLVDLEKQCKLEYLNSLNLNKLLDKKRFRPLEGTLLNTTLKSIRSIFNKTIDSLINKGNAINESTVINEVKNCIEAINELNNSNNNFMANINSDMIYEEVEEIIYAAGVNKSDNLHLELIEQWRTW